MWPSRCCVMAGRRRSRSRWGRARRSAAPKALAEALPHFASMRPIAIFRFSKTEGPAHFAEWLDRASLPWTLIAVDEGHAIPDDPGRFSGIGMMGGPMSATDALPWIEPLSTLLRDAVETRVPVIGHCLGGQLLAQALGARVQRTNTPEIGWIDVETTDV